MSTINNDLRPLAGPSELPGARPARPILPDPSRGHATSGAGPGRAVGNAGQQPDAESATGKVYALKDGSGYVALATDGHYYKLEPGGAGLTYASASGPVDKSMVDVSHGPVRSMRPAPVAHRSPAHGADDHPPATALGRDAAAAGPGESQVSYPGSPSDDSRRGTGPASGARTGSDAQSAGPADATIPAPPSPTPAGTGSAALAAHATHGLILRHPGEALRSHSGVSTRSVLALLR